LLRVALTAIVLLAVAAPANAALKVVSVFGTTGTAPGQLNAPKDVTTDSAGNVYVANESNARVDKYSPDGTYLQSFGSSGSQPGQLSLPVGVAVASGGQVWVSDFDGTRGRITVYNPDGSLLLTFGASGGGDGQFRSPGAITLDPAGNAYVVDTGNSRVEKFTPDGVFITKWGTQGSGDGQFNGPRGITVDSDGAVVVADRDNTRVQRFTQDGAFLGKFGTPVTPNGDFGSVYDVAAVPGGGLFTADNGLFDLEKFTNAGAFLFQANAANSFDGTPAAGLRPVAVTVAADGSVYSVGTQTPSFVAKFAQVDPQPVIAKTAAAKVVAGTVLVKAPGATTFTALTAAASAIPIGSLVDASKGTVSLVTSTGVGSKTQGGSFNGGSFTLLQKKQGGGVTELALQGGGNFKKLCSAKAAAGAARKPSRQLLSNAHGRFRTRGRYSSATVRGTKWLTKDTCAGTLTQVMRGSVTVLDLVKHKSIRVKAGHSYIAKPRKLGK
jgi:hypothetical protein